VTSVRLLEEVGGAQRLAARRHVQRRELVEEALAVPRHAVELRLGRGATLGRRRDHPDPDRLGKNEGHAGARLGVADQRVQRREPDADHPVQRLLLGGDRVAADHRDPGGVGDGPPAAQNVRERF